MSRARRPHRTRKNRNQRCHDNITVKFEPLEPRMVLSVSVDVQILQSSDDAEERLSDGGVDLTSTDIELGNDPGFNENQVEGLRFQNVDIPQGATITSAYLEFETDETNSAPTVVVIRAQAADNAPTFTTSTNNITNRSTTTANVNWNIPTWSTVNEKHQSPDLAALVQEVVNRPGWNANNSMVFIISGSGERTAESYNGEPAAAARLHVEYLGDGSPNAVNDTATTNENVPVDIAVVANDSDPEGDTISIDSFTQGAAGVVTDNLNGTLRYTPNLNESGADSFTYTISDGNGGFDTATVNVLVFGSTIRFAAIGDYGANTTAEAQVAAMINTQSPDFVVTAGDNRYGSLSMAQAVGDDYGQYLPTTNPDGSSPFNAFFPAPGNHDYSDGGGISQYLSYFDLPGAGIPSTNTSGSELYYDVIQGPVHFFMIDSNANLNDQQDWLEAEMSLSTTPWQVVVLHHAPYSSSSVHGSQSFVQWDYAAWGADAVIAGHDHIYERIERDGILYFVNGLGGRSIYGIEQQPIAGSQFQYNGNYGAMIVDASRTAMTFQFRTRTGALIDSYTLTGPTPPVAANDNGNVDEGGSVNVALAANDVDVDEGLDLASIQITTNPANGSVVANNDGTVDYMHNGGETLSDSFTYTISDLAGVASNVATVNLTINPVFDVSVVASDANKNEGDSGPTPFEFTISLDDYPGFAVSVDWTTTGSGTHPADSADFGGVLPSGNVVFTSDRPETITLDVTGDSEIEFDENFTVTISNVTPGVVILDETATGTIVTDDVVVGEGFYLCSVPLCNATADSRNFFSSDTLYVNVFSDEMNFNDMKKATYKFEDSDKNKFQGNLTNNLNGTFTVALSLSSFELGSVKSEFKLEDEDGNKYAAKNVIFDIAAAPPVGVTLSESGGSTDVVEAGATDTYTLVLDSQPTDDVTINITTHGETLVNPTSVTFTGSDWNVARTILVTADDDTDPESNHTSLITHVVSSNDPFYDGLSVDNVTANVTDNDTPGILVSKSSTNVVEGGATDTYTVELLTLPTGPVTVTLDPDAQVDLGAGGGSPIMLTFTTGDWFNGQLVTVTAVDDMDSEGNHTGTIEHTAAGGGYGGVPSVFVTANMTDNDAPVVKFFVVDNDDNETFQYDADVSQLGVTSLEKGNKDPRGVASDPSGTMNWVVDKDKYVYVYLADGTFLGSWKADGAGEPGGIDVDGDDILIADKGKKKIFRFDGAAAVTSGTLTPTSEFVLDSDNSRPTGMTTDGSSIWVVDEGKDEVFKYTTSGTLLGRWELDASNDKALGITIDPSNVDHIWTVDGDEDQIFQYNGGTLHTSGQYSADFAFDLSVGNAKPMGIADPPPPGTYDAGAAASVAIDALQGASRAIRFDRLRDLPIQTLATLDRFDASLHGNRAFKNSLPLWLQSHAQRVDRLMSQLETQHRADQGRADERKGLDETISTLLLQDEVDETGGLK